MLSLCVCVWCMNSLAASIRKIRPDLLTEYSIDFAIPEEPPPDFFAGTNNQQSSPLTFWHTIFLEKYETRILVNCYVVKKVCSGSYTSSHNVALTKGFIVPEVPGVGELMLAAFIPGVTVSTKKWFVSLHLILGVRVLGV